MAGLTGCGAKEKPPITENPPKDTSSASMDSEAPTQEEPGHDYMTTTSMEEFLTNAKLPLGTTLYVWGGGWNEADDGAGEEAVSMGISPKWKKYFDANDASYNYKDHKYQIHDGLDCSGYLGWVIYNTFENEDGKEGYVMSSTEMAKTYASKGWGEYTDSASVTDWKTGDVMSMKGHVWIALGTCEDQSVLLMHASPPGVRLSGTKLADGSDSQAVKLAAKYMKANYSEWSNRYSECGVDASYLTKSSRMRWNTKIFADADQFRDMTPEEVLEWMFD